MLFRSELEENGNGQALSYGTKISEVSKNIQESVRFSLENQLGITAQTVNVYIQNIKVVGE